MAIKMFVYYFLQRTDSSSERSFQILEVNFAKEAELEALNKPAVYRSEPILNNNSNQLTYKHIHNDLHQDYEEDDAETDDDDEQATSKTVLPTLRPSYSMNIERHSIFHPDYQSPARQDPHDVIKLLDSSFDNSNDANSMEYVRKDTDNRLSRYFKNYGELAGGNFTNRSRSEQRNRGTQTTPDTLRRRDTVLNGSQNLSMPLLREMPKMTRNESTRLLLQQNQRKIDNLKRRWEVGF